MYPNFRVPKFPFPVSQYLKSVLQSPMLYAWMSLILIELVSPRHYINSHLQVVHKISWLVHKFGIVKEHQQQELATSSDAYTA